MNTPYVLPTHDQAVANARCLCYRWAASALSDPLTGGWEELIDPATHDIIAQAAAILRDEDGAVARPLARGEQPLSALDPAPLVTLLPASRNELNTLYDRNFGLLSGSKCPPYETEYVPSKFTFQRSNMLADVAGYYQAFGLQCSTTCPERSDHIVLELQFMAQLIQLELVARDHQVDNEAGNAEICLEAQGRFLQEHVVWWMPAFCTLLERQDPTGYYARVATFIAALVTADRALFGIESPHLVPEPSPLEEPDACSGCELAIR